MRELGNNPRGVWKGGLGAGGGGRDPVEEARRELAMRRIFLAMISTVFVHWKVLGQMPFFLADEPTWMPAVSLDGDRPDAGIRVMPTVCRAAEP